MNHFVHGSVRCKLKEERRKRKSENDCLFGLVELGQLSKWLTLSHTSGSCCAPFVFADC